MANLQREAVAMRSSALAPFWDRLVASDPGLTRLALAIRVTAAILLSVVTLQICTPAFDLPVTVVLLGAIVALQTSLAVNDAEPRVTMLLVPIPGVLGTWLGTIFASRGILADVVFLAVLFAAVAVRALGPRWTAFGTIATMTYFFALFLGATSEQFPALSAAVGVGAGFSFLSRFVFFPDRAGWIAKRTVDAFEARIRLVTVAAGKLLAAADLRHARQELQRAVQRLNETAASIEAHLGSDAGDEVRIIFDAELAAEDLAAAVIRWREKDAPLPRALRLALLALGRGRVARAARVAARVSPEHSPTVESAALAEAIVNLDDALRRVEATAAALALSDAPWGSGAGLQQPPLRQAIQVTVAAAASIALGEALSPQRWYWAVLAAYFVFTGTASSGETLARAWSRIAGTAIGVAAGLVAGHFAKSHPALDVVAIFVCLFLSVYFLRISHMLMIFFITATLALLYTSLGRFSDGVLAIRLAETAIGAVCGGLAATLIFPTRTRDVVRNQAKDALAAASDVVSSSIARLIDPSAAVEPLVAARILEERVQQFVARAKPVVSLPVLLGRGHTLRRWIVSLSACSYYARALARIVDRAAAPLHDGAVAPLQRLGLGIVANIEAAAERVDDRKDVPTTDTVPIFEEVRRAAQGEGAATESLDSAAYLLERMDRTIARLAREDAKITDTKS